MKAIIEIDLPSNCHECPICVEDYDNLYCGLSREVVSDFWAGEFNRRPPHCPLKIVIESENSVEEERKMEA